MPRRQQDESRQQAVEPIVRRKTIVGRIMADLITTGATDLPIAPFAIDRFASAAQAPASFPKEQHP